jgi:integrase
LKVAYQRGKVSRNAAELVDAPRRSTVRAEQYLTPDQAKAFIAHIEGRWNAARWSVGLAVGSRQGETLALRWPDVNLDAGTVTVRAQLQRHRGEDGKRSQLVVVEWTKNKKPRTIQLPDELVAELRAHRKAQNERRLAIGTDWEGSPLGEFVFSTQYGRAIEPRADWQDWTNILAELGFPHIRLHAARHTAATLLLAMGIDAVVVAKILGNDPAITQLIYQHVTENLDTEAAAAMSAALWGT